MVLTLLCCSKGKDDFSGGSHTHRGAFDLTTSLIPVCVKKKSLNDGVKSDLLI